jgi:CCR4-NOT transcription complex subunit 1
VQLADSVRKLYYGTLRTLLVLLHDFPEFLCECHFCFCDILPAPCVQIRNIILSAFPRDMRLPYPYRGLEIDQVPEIRQSPPILSDYQSVLLQLNLKADVDAYARSREKRLLESIRDKLRLPEEEACKAETSYNVPLMSALLLYVGMDLPKGQVSGQSAQLQGADMEIFFCLAQGLDMEGRYTFLGTLANHLRYPNTHTYYFSRVLLRLFESAPEEVVQEQIIRVLLERLVVHRPHPWGLLITFIELIQDRRYDLWNHSLTRISPEITRVLGNFVNSFIGSDGSSALAGGAGGTGAEGAVPAADATPA